MKMVIWLKSRFHGIIFKKKVDDNMKYKYQTDTISYGLSKQKLTNKLQELLDQRSKDGWRLVKYDFSDWLGACVVVFEKEVQA